MKVKSVEAKGVLADLLANFDEKEYEEVKKEIIMEDYKIRYEEALKRAKEIYQGSYKPDTAATIAEILQNIFPELKESEDERIRRVLIELVKCNERSGYKLLNNVPTSSMIAWLEKQGERPKKLPIWKHWKNGIAGNGEGGTIYLIKYGHTYSLSSCLHFECDYIELSELDKLLSEKQGEQKVTYTAIMETGNGGINALVQGELPADKIKPKFKVGDWITNGDYTWKIVEVKPLDYILQSQDGNIVDDTISYVDEQFHSFTIEDAKDGDVLYSLDSKKPFIYKERKPHEQATAYCGINIYGKFFVWQTKDCIITTDKYTPATKEQRDLLFHKMKDAGYEWDAEKKELKKISQRMVSAEAKEALLQDKPAWSEEDERNLKKAVWYVENPAPNVVKDIMLSEWLKSLKARCAWKL